MSNRRELHPGLVVLLVAQTVALGLLSSEVGLLAGLLALVVFVVHQGVLSVWLRTLVITALPLIGFLLVIQGGLMAKWDPESVASAVRASAPFGGRILLALGAVLALGKTVQWDQMAAVILCLRIPLDLRLILVSSLNTAPEIRRRFAAVLDAQRLRGVNTGGAILKRALRLPPLLFPVLLSTLSYATTRSIALEVRGFGALEDAFTPFLDVADTRVQKRLRLILGLTLVSTLVAAVIT